MNYIATNLATGETHQARTYRNAQAWTARMISSDVEGQKVLIDGPGTGVLAFNTGMGITYVDTLNTGRK